MTTQARNDALVERYLSDLEQALRNVSPTRRRSIIEEVADHIAIGRAALDPADEAGLRDMLARVGDPESIAAEEGVDQEQPTARLGDAAVPWLLLLGGFIAGIGWVVGVVMLWLSETWSRGDKLLGTLVLPGGLLGLVILLTRASRVVACSGSGAPGEPTIMHCTSSGLTLPLGVSLPLTLILITAPTLTAIHLDRVRRRG
jgi:uncharacterized membrane protein